MSGWPSLQERFWAAVEKTDTCWLWTRPLAGNGYGQIRSGGGTPRPAHRVSYELNVGPIPEGLVIDHLCRNRACVNPAHLEPVTNRTNILRGEGPSARQARQTHCKRDHPLSGPNLMIDKAGKRHCHICMTMHNRARPTRRRDREALAAREAASLDHEWFDLSGDER